VTLRAVNLNIMRLRATALDPSDEESVRWRLTFIDKRLSGKHVARPIYALLRATSERGWAEIEVSAVVRGGKKATQESLSKALVDDDIAENLYDYARSHLQSRMAQVRSEQYMSLHAPEHELRYISSEEFDEMAAEAEAEEAV